MYGREEGDEQARISERAAEWYIRLRDENLSKIDRQRYLLWLKQSPTHIAEILRMEGLHHSLTAALSEHRNVCGRE